MSMKILLIVKRFCLGLFVLLGLISCVDSLNPATYYTFKDDTVASYLEKNEEDFSSFIEVLKRAKVWGEMRTYGEYTCFAPTNEAFEIYLQENNLSSLDELTDLECDTIAQTHILNQAYFTTDLVEGAFPSPNRLDRYLTFSCDSDTLDNNKLFYRVNKTARMLQRDDTVQNGVMQIVDRVIEPSTLTLPYLMKSDTAISIFYEALVLTRMCDSLEDYTDENYRTPGNDSCTTGVPYHTGNENEFAIFPEKRYFKFSAFVEPNSVYRAAGINNIEDLIEYAKKIYDESYPNDAGKYDDDFTNRRNPLNRFVSYHLLEFYGTYNMWNVTDETIIPNFVRSEWDIEDFFETLLPHSFLRICTPERANPNGIYINRKGTPKNQPKSGSVERGVRMLAPSEISVQQDALNGIYHYIDGILTYSHEVRTNVLNTRIRYDCTTMSPDFVNSGGRGKPGETNCTGMLNGFTKWWKFSPETLLSIRNRHQWFYSYQGDEVILQGIYDATVKLPPVPFDGTYEIRIGYPVMASRGVIQAYFNGEPTDIPTDLRVSGPDPRVGWESDAGKTPEQIRQLDKAMRNRGYMKAPASYRPGGGDVFRNIESMLRRIITTQYISAESDNYLRVRQILDNDNAEMVYDYLEIVPKDVFASDEGEDIY